MAKAFDLIHKVTKDEQPEESRIPFDESNKTKEAKPKRPKLEIAFFYLLLFIVFFIIGANFLSPTFFASLIGKNEPPLASPSPLTSPAAGFAIEKEGQSVESASKDLNVPSPTPAASPAQVVSEQPAGEATATQAAKIQILNGTTRTGAAARMRTKLASIGIVVASIGNYRKRNVSQTTIYYHPDYKTAAEQVQSIIGGVLSPTTTGIGSYDILVVIGLR